MITLSRSLDEHLAACALLHTRLCPRQVLGVRMARMACVWLGIDPAVSRKQIFVFMECGRCAADAVIAVTGASPTNDLMRLMCYGTVAATFVDLKTGVALRVCEHPDSRRSAVQILPRVSTWEAQRDAYQSMPDDLLLQWQPIKLLTEIPAISDKRSVICQACGSRINEGQEVVGVWQDMPQTLCKPCANGAYYKFINIPG